MDTICPSGIMSWHLHVRDLVCGAVALQWYHNVVYTQILLVILRRFEKWECATENCATVIKFGQIISLRDFMEWNRCILQSTSRTVYKLVTPRIRLLTMGWCCVYTHSLNVETGSVACAPAHSTSTIYYRGFLYHTADSSSRYLAEIVLWFM